MIETMSYVPGSTDTIAIVASNAFDYGPVDLDSDVSAPPGRDFAVFLEQRLAAFGAKQPSAPYAGEEGWTFDIEISSKRFRIFVHWAPIGNPPADRWVIQPNICMPLLRSLFGRKTTAAEIEGLIGELHRALDGASEIDEIKWVSREEFASMY